MYSKKCKKPLYPGAAQAAENMFTTFTILQNIRIKPETPNNSTAGVSSKDGGARGVLQVPFEHHQDIANAGIPRTDDDFPELNIPEGFLDGVPESLIAEIENLEKNVLAKPEASTSASNGTDAGTSGSQIGMPSKASLPDAREFYVPKPVSPLPEANHANCVPPKRQRISLAMKRTGGTSEEDDDCVFLSASVVPARKCQRKESQLKKLLLQPQDKIEMKNKSVKKNGPVAVAVAVAATASCSNAASVETPACRDAVLPAEERGLGAGQKRIQIDGAENQTSDSDSESEFFSQSDYQDAYKLVKRAVNDLRKKRQQALGSVREVDEELQAIEEQQRLLAEQQRLLEERKHRLQTDRIGFKRIADSAEKKIAALPKRLGF